MKAVLSLLLLYIAATTAAPTDSDCPLFCAAIWAPVCGTDGKNYDNECKFRAAKCLETDVELEILHTGKCVDCDEECTRELKPVCGTNGQTYNNKCLLDKASCGKKIRIEVASMGPCTTGTDGTDGPAKEDPCKKECTKILKPVCGTNRETYDNECLLEKATCRLRIRTDKAHDGPCEEGEESRPESKESEEAASKVEEILPRQGDPCREFKCTRILKPVCGSDGMTYSNECTMNFSACKARTVVAKSSNGPCPAIPNDGGDDDDDKDHVESCRRFKCTRILKPVCGSDGQTHSNECTMNFSACLRRSRVTKEHEGPCKTSGEAASSESDKKQPSQPPRPVEACQSFCPLLFKQVCGSDGETYSNKCLLETKACREGKADLVVDHNGPCTSEDKGDTTTTSRQVEGKECSSVCITTFDPVCGSDGVTYSNECNLEAVACHLSEVITVVLKGKCPIVEAAVADEEQEEEEQEQEAPVEKPDGIIFPPPVAECSVHCPQIFSPVCGSDGITYDNPCEVERKECTAHVKLTYTEGACPTADEEPEQAPPCPEICPANFAPVCGTDGETYSNKCNLEVQNCKKGGSVTVDFDGPCPTADEGPDQATPPPCPEICLANYAPVCGTDGKTYSNACKLQAANCKKNNNVMVASEGPCPPLVIESVVAEQEEDFIEIQPVEAEQPAEVKDCDMRCEQLFLPVCGSDGVMYNNKCLLGIETCKSDGKISQAKDDSACT